MHFNFNSICCNKPQFLIVVTFESVYFQLNIQIDQSFEKMDGVIVIMSTSKSLGLNTLLAEPFQKKMSE